MKKLLLSDHSFEANSFISELESKILPAIKMTCSKIKVLGIELPSKELFPVKDFLFDIINGKFELLQSKYWALNFSSVEHFQSIAVREEMKSVIMDKFYEFCTSVAKAFSETINNRPLNDPSFLKFIDFDTTGMPYIPDPAKEEIKEAFREYLTDSRQIKTYEAQQKACKALQELWDSATDIGLTTHMLPGHIVGFFEFGGTDDKVIFSIRPLNFDYAAAQASRFEA